MNYIKLMLQISERLADIDRNRSCRWKSQNKTDQTKLNRL